MSTMDSDVFKGYPTHIEKAGGLLKISLQKDHKLGLFVESYLHENLKELKSTRFIPKRDDIAPGALGIGQYDDQQYYRIQILEEIHQNNVVSVLFIDYGNIASLSLSDIRLLNYEVHKALLNIPALAFSCFLEKVWVGKPWNEDGMSSLKKLVLYGEKQCVVRQLHPRVKVVNIFLHNTNKSLTELILENDLGSPISDVDLLDAVKRMKSNRLGAVADERAVPKALAQQFSQRMPSITADIYQNERLLPSREQSFNFSSAHLLPVGSSHNAYISHMEDGPYSFSIQLKSSAEDALPRLTRLLRQHDPIVNTLPLLPGTMVMTRYNNDNSLRRSIVMDVKSDKCQVYHTDYGSSEEVPFSEVFELPSQAHHGPSMALRFCLADIKNTQVTETSKTQFEELLLGKQVLIRVVKQESEGPLLQYCEMFYEGRNVKDIIVAFNAPLEFTVQPPPRGKDLKVTVSHIESPSLFFIQYNSKLDLLNNIQEAVNVYCKNQARLKEPSGLSIGSPVGALFEDNIWYRGMILSLGTESHQVSYVDYGNRCDIYINQMCQISRDLVTKWRTQAVECCLRGFENDNVNDVDEELIAEMEDTLNRSYNMTPIKMLATNRLLVELIDEIGNKLSDKIRNLKNKKQESTKALSASTHQFKEVKVPADSTSVHETFHMEGTKRTGTAEQKNVNLFIRPSIRPILEQENKPTVPIDETHKKRPYSEHDDRCDDITQTYDRQSSFEKPRSSRNQDGARRNRDNLKSPTEDYNSGFGSKHNSSRESYNKSSGFGKSTPTDDNRRGRFRSDDTDETWSNDSKFGDKSKFGGRQGKQNDYDLRDEINKSSWNRESLGGEEGSKRDSGRFGGNQGKPGGGRRDDGEGGGRFGGNRRDEGESGGRFRGNRRDDGEGGGKFGGNRRDDGEGGGRFGGNRQDDREGGGRFGGNRRDDGEGGGRFGGNRRDDGEGGGRFGGNRQDDREGGGRFGGNRRDDGEGGGRFGGNRRDDGEGGGRFGGNRQDDREGGGRFGGNRRDDGEGGGRFGGNRRDNGEGGGRFGGRRDDGERSNRFGGRRDDGEGGGRFAPRESGGGRFGSGDDQFGKRKREEGESGGWKHGASDEWKGEKSRGNDGGRFRGNDGGRSRPNDAGGRRTGGRHGNDTFGKKSDSGWSMDNDLQANAGTGGATEEWDDSPSPVTSTTVSAFYPPQIVKPGSELEVILSSISHPHQFYVQQVGCEVEIDQMRADIDNLTIELKQLKEDSLAPGVPVLARFSEDQALYRGIVNSLVPSKQAKIIFIDYGNSEVLPFSEMFYIPTEILSKPPFALHCKLYDIQPKNNKWPEDTSIFDPYLNADDVLTLKVINVKKIDGEMVIDVTLIDPAGVSISQKLIDAGLVVSSLSSTKSKEGPAQEIISPPASQIDTPISAQYAESETHSAASKTPQPTLDGDNIYSSKIPKLSDKWTDRFELLKNQILQAEILELIDERSFVIKIIDAKVVTLGILSDHQEGSCIIPGSKVIAEIVAVLEDRLEVTLFGLNGIEKGPFVKKTKEARTVSPICKFPVVRQSDRVRVVYSEGETVFIQKASDADRLTQLLDEMHNFYDETPLEKNEWDFHTVCCAKSLADMCWYRAQIIPSEEKYTVRYLDYGNTEVLPPENLRTLSSQFYLNEMALGVSLPVSWKSADSSIMDIVQEEEYFSTILRDSNGQWTVNLISTSGERIIDVLVKGNLADENPENPFLEINSVIGSDISCDDVVPIIVSHADSPTMFWVQKQSQTEAVEYLQERLQSVAVIAEPSTSLNKVFAAKYAEDEVWYRASKVDDDTLRFIDYGNTDFLTESKNLPEEFMKPYSGYAIPMYLCVKPTDSDWSDDAIKEFRMFIDHDDIVAEIINVNFKIVVDLRGGDKLLSKILIDGGHATYCDYVPEIVKKYSLESVDSNSISTLDKVKVYVSHTNSVNDFYIQDEAKSDQIQFIADTLFEVEDNDSLSDVQIGEMYAVRFDDDVWYRAKVVSKDPEINVFFVDFGNTFLPNDFRALPNILLDKEPLAIHCSLDIEESDDVLQKFLSLSKYGNEPFYMKVKNNGSPATVELFDENDTNILSHLGISPVVTVTPTPRREKVYVTHIYGPDSFYAQTQNLLCKSDELALKLIDAENFKKLEEIAVGNLITALYPDDSSWYRGLVLATAPDIVVRFVDYGNTSTITEYRELPDELQKIEHLTIKCSLQPPSSLENWSEDSVELFSTICSNSPDSLEIEYIASDTVFTVELYVNGEPVTEKLLSKQKLKGYITHINSVSDFYIQRKDCADLLNQIQSGLTVLEENPDKKPDCGIGSIIAAKFDGGDWYRGQILQIGPEVRVKFIDYGNECNVTEISSLTEELLQIPPIAVKCSLDLEGVLIKENANRLFKKRCGESQIDFSIKSVVDSLNIVEIILDDKNVLTQLCSNSIDDEIHEDSESGLEEIIDRNNDILSKEDECLPGNSIHEDKQDIVPDVFDREVSNEMTNVSEEGLDTECSNNSIHEDKQDIVPDVFDREVSNEMTNVSEEGLDTECSNNSIHEDKQDIVPDVFDRDVSNEMTNVSEEGLDTECSNNSIHEDKQDIVPDVFDREVSNEMTNVSEEGLDTECSNNSIEKRLSPEPNDKQLKKKFIPFVNSISDFYVTSNTVELTLIEQGLVKADNFENPTSVKKDDILAGKTTEGVWYRCKIEDIISDVDYKVFLIDYGYSSHVVQVKELCPDLISMKPAAMHCTLFVPEGIDSWSEKALEIFSEMCSDVSDFQIVNDNVSPCVVTLKTDIGDLSDYLAKSCVPNDHIQSKTSKEQVSEESTTKPIKEELIKEKSTKEVVIKTKSVNAKNGLEKSSPKKSGTSTNIKTLAEIKANAKSKINTGSVVTAQSKKIVEKLQEPLYVHTSFDDKPVPGSISNPPSPIISDMSNPTSVPAPSSPNRFENEEKIVPGAISSGLPMEPSSE